MPEATIPVSSADASRSRSSAGGSDVARAREWINAKKPYEVFWLHEVPGDPKVTRSLMSRLAKDENSGVRRLRRGFYIKGEWLSLKSMKEEPDGFWYLYPRTASQRLYTVSRYMGDTSAGFGLAKYDALSVFHWTTQCPILTTLSVVRRNLPMTPLPEQVILEKRSNERRLELSIPENTIIEAARFSYMRVNRLKENLSVFERPAYAFQRMNLYIPKSMIVVRPDMLVWGAEAEYGQPPKVREIVEAVADILKEDIVYTDIAQ